MEEKRRFLAIWKTLGAHLPPPFRERLSSLGIGYNGMVQRAAADRIRGDGYAFPEGRHYVVAGFNALSECEKRLFGFLPRRPKPIFTGTTTPIIRTTPNRRRVCSCVRNVAQFPPRTELRHDNMRGEKQIVSVAAVSNAVQCKYAGRILADLPAAAGGRPARTRPRWTSETAVVLTDENLLLPLLYALPADIGNG